MTDKFVLGDRVTREIDVEGTIWRSSIVFDKRYFPNVDADRAMKNAAPLLDGWERDLRRKLVIKI